MDRLSMQKLPFSKKRLPPSIILSYIFDYLIILALGFGFYALDRVEPFHQHFSLRNYTLQYPYAVHERVPIPLLVAVSFLFPVVAITFYTLVIDGIFSHRKKESTAGGRFSGRYRWRDRLWELNCGILGLLLSEGAAFVITGALKNAAGKPRPDLIDRCQPRPGSVDPPVFGLSSHSICTQEDNAILKDGFRSFPSGHSSSAFAGLFYLSLYLAAKLHVLDTRGEVWKSFIVLIPTLAAALIAISRIMDARHHPFDVISGSMLGATVAWGSYRQYFPPVSDTWHKGKAYPVRSWGKPLKQPPTREVRFEEGSEPLRTARDIPAGGHEEQAARSGAASGINVFREQIQQSQRRRETEHGSGRAHRQREDWSETSSEDGLEGRGSLEMQPRYTLTDLEGGTSRLMGGAEGGDTSYHSQTRQQVDSHDPDSVTQPPSARIGDESIR